MAISSLRSRVLVLPLSLLALACSGGETGQAPASFARTESAVTTYTVTSLADSGAGSLRDALTSANASVGADVISVTATGTISLASALPDISDDVTISGPGSSSLTITRAGAADYRLFTIAAGKTVSLSGLTASNGRATVGGCLNAGLDSTMTLTDTTWLSCAATVGSGGAIYSEGTLSFISGLASGNASKTSGGAISIQGVALTVTGSTFEGNSSLDSGGAIRFSAATTTITSSTFINNSAALNGGAVANTGLAVGPASLSNCTFVDNGTASGRSFKAMAPGSVTTATNCTFHETVGTNPAPVALTGSGAQFKPKNCIFSTTASAVCSAIGPGITSLGNNLSTTTTCGTPAAGDKANTNPRLLPLANYGGPTKTLALAWNSPAIDAGDPSGAPTVDQRGAARPTDGNADGAATIDLGAYEAAANTAPVLNDTGSPTLLSVNEDPSANNGTLISELLATGAGGKPITDADTAVAGDPDGIAITGATTTTGTWQYSTNGGVAWTTLGTPSTTAARLLLSDASTRLRFVPNANATGSETLTFVAWDGRSGANGGAVDLTSITTGGTSSFSTASETASITVLPVNDPPSLSAVANQTTTQGVALPPIVVTVGDVDSPLSSITLTATSSDQTLVKNTKIVISGSDATRTIVITPESTTTGTATITLVANDGAKVASRTFTVTVAEGDAPPTIAAIGDASTFEDLSTTASLTIDDVDTPVTSLVVTATSSNTTLMPAAGLTFTGSNASRTLWLQPAADQSGTATITVTVKDGVTTVSTSFVLTVTAVNDRPTIVGTDTTIITAEDVAVPAIPFTVADVETPTAALIVTATSSKPALVPLTGIVLSGTGADRTFAITPAANAFGTAIITLTVSDGTVTAESSFSVYVASVEDAPTITSVGDRTTPEDTPTPAYTFTVGDVETAPAELVVTARSSDTVLVPNERIVLGGAGSERTVTISPNANRSGSTTITLTVSDGSGLATTSMSFVLAVTAVNDAPTVSVPSTVQTPEDTPKHLVPLALYDVDTDLATLTVTASSSDTTLLPDAAITISGTGGARKVSLVPAANQFGTATVTFSVSDGEYTDTASFTFTVYAEFDSPTISTLAAQTTPEDTPMSGLTVTVADVDTALADLTMFTSSSNPTLVSDSAIVVTGTGASRTVTVTPSANQSGTTTITLTVSDMLTIASSTFVLTVTPVNDAPEIAELAPRSLDEDTSTGPISLTISDVDTELGALVVTASSSDPALFPAEGLLISTGGDALPAGATLTATPAAGASGSAVITVSVFDGASTTTTALELTVVPVDDPPALSAIGPIVLAEDGTTGPIAFTVADADADLAEAVLSVTADDASLFGTSGLVIGGAGAERTLTLTPVPNAHGETTVTLQLTSGGLTTERAVSVTVTPVDDAPTIAAVGPQSTKKNVPLADLPVLVDDVDSTALTVTATSSDPALIAASGLVVTEGQGGQRLLTLTPASGAVGSATITLTVSDGALEASTSFTFEVLETNAAPTVGALANVTTPEDTMAGPIAIAVGDADGLESVTVTVASDDATLLPEGSLALSGTGASRALTLTPAPNLSGTAVLTVTASDGQATATSSFQLEVTAVNDAPTISALDPQTVLENDSLEGLAFTVGDIDTDAAALTVTGASSDEGLLAPEGLTITSGADGWTVSLTPEADMAGTLTVTLTVSDGERSADSAFELTITPTDLIGDGDLDPCAGAEGACGEPDAGPTDADVAQSPDTSGAADAGVGADTTSMGGDVTVTSAGDGGSGCQSGAAPATTMGLAATLLALLFALRRSRMQR